MLYPDLPMGTESYYIYISQDNHEITGDDPTSLSGKRIGVNKGSIQEGFLADWAKKNGVTFEIVPLVVDEDESMALVERGEVDGYATVYTISAENRTVPIYRIGGSDYFYAVNKNRPDLRAELNMALAGIQDEDPYFAERISEERLYEKRTNIALQPNQEEWLKKHGKIRIGYRDNYMPFCQADEETGELTGALKDYLAHATNELSSVDLQFETDRKLHRPQSADGLPVGRRSLSEMGRKEERGKLCPEECHSLYPDHFRCFPVLRTHGHQLDRGYDYGWCDHRLRAGLGLCLEDCAAGEGP